ncbi:MAG TPA: BamA/TamA family outer membrane protein [Bacillota bacterium]|nr:BamA/TamA family outer membrane protein [Bacillota bacterium]HPT59991.1 BamA/TamA family outer membrane protein [Bacillota bacterium]
MKKKSSMLCFMLMMLILSLQAPLAAGSDVAAIVTSIGVSGNREVSTSEILAVIKATQVGEPLDEQKLMQDMQAITEMGYFSLVEVEPSFYLGGMRVVFKVHENPVISGVEVELDTDEVPEEALLEAMNIPIGKIFNANILTPERMQEVIDEIVVKYGLFLQPTEVNIDEDNVFKISFKTNRIADVKVTGLDKTKEHVVRRYVNIKAGDALKSTELEKLYGKLYNTGYFDSVNIYFEPTDNPLEPIMVIDVTERKSGEVIGGLGYSSLDGVVGYLQYQEDNFLGYGQQVATRLELGRNKRMFGLSFYEPFLGSSATSLGLEATISHSKTELGENLFVENNRKGINLSIGRPLTEYLRLSLTGTIDNNLETLSQTNQTTDWKTRSVGFILSYDNANHFLFPSKGQRVSLTGDFGGKIIGGNYTYQKYELDVAKYIGLDKEGKHVLALHAQGGVIKTPDARLPEHMKYFLGGPDTVRGYRWGAFQGNSLLLANVEYRYLISDAIQLVGFADLGEIADEGVKADNLKFGFGPGIRINTPIGPIRLDFGFSRENGKWQSQFHFSLGQAF